MLMSTIDASCALHGAHWKVQFACLQPMPCVATVSSCTGATDQAFVCFCCQELHILKNEEVTGSSLTELPRCCPGLRVLRLQQLRRLTGGFFLALQQLEVWVCRASVGSSAFAAI
jgi:hypothetical protein